MFNYLRNILIILSLHACSTSKPENGWQYEATRMSKNYQNNFLQNKTLRASLDLKHARELAKRSANLEPLINIELTACGMEISALNTSECTEASKLLRLQANDEQQAYLHLLLLQIQLDEIKYLPQQYQSFTRSLLNKDDLSINKEIASMKPFSSKLIASSLSKELLNDENIDQLIQELSFKGFKRPLLSWLRFQMDKEKDKVKKAHLKAKIDVLTSD